MNTFCVCPASTLALAFLSAVTLVYDQSTVTITPRTFDDTGMLDAEIDAGAMSPCTAAAAAA